MSLPTRYAEPDAEFPVVRGPFDYQLPERARPMPLVHNEREAIAELAARQSETRNTVGGVAVMVCLAVAGAKIATGASVAPLIGGAICCAVIVALFRGGVTRQRCEAPKQTPQVTVTVETKVNVTIQ